MRGGGDGLGLQELPRVQGGAYGCDADEQVENASPPAPLALFLATHRTDFHCEVECSIFGIWMRNRYFIAMQQAAAGGSRRQQAAAQRTAKTFFIYLKVKLYQQISSAGDLQDGIETTLKKKE